MTTTTTMGELPGLVGQELGTSDWREVTQDAVNLFAEVLVVSDTAMGLNYGLDKLRFPSPVPVGSKVRASAVLEEVSEFAGGLQYSLAVTVEREGGEKPVCIAEPVYRVYGG